MRKVGFVAAVVSVALVIAVLPAFSRLVPGDMRTREDDVNDAASYNEQRPYDSGGSWPEVVAYMI